MKSREVIGMFQAKTHFSEIVDRVVRERRPITITRRGEPVVEIRPLDHDRPPRRSRAQALADLKALQSELPKLTPAEIRDAIDEGRR